MAASPTNTVPITKLMELKADAVSYRERLATIDPAQFGTIADVVEWLKNELGLNLAPMFESTVDAIHEDVVAELRDVADALDDHLEETGDQLTEETSGQILVVFEQGRALCNLLEGIAKNLNEVSRKRIQQAIKLYRTSETAVRELVVAVTMMPEEGDEDDDDEEEETATEPGGDEAVPGAAGEDLTDLAGDEAAAAAAELATEEG